MKIRINSIAVLVISLIFLSATLQHSGESTSNFGLVPPPVVVSVGLVFLYSVYFSLATLFFLGALRGSVKIYRGGYLYVGLSYLLLLALAMIYRDDVLRYFFLAITCIVIPNSVARIAEKSGVDVIKRGVSLGASLYIILAAVVCYINYGGDVRLSGYMTNPNAFAFSVLICLLIVLFLSGFSIFKKILLLSICFFMIYLAGSRSASLASLIIVFLWVNGLVRLKFSRVAYFSFLCILVAAAFMVLSGGNFEDSDRIFQISSALSDSGRDSLYEDALREIWRSPWLGNGMTAHETILGTGNVHNSFLRILFMSGLPLGIAFFFLFFRGLWEIYKSNPEDGILRAFVIILPLLIFGEDYIVGIGSFFYFFLLMFLSFSVIERNNARLSR